MDVSYLELSELLDDEFAGANGRLVCDEVDAFLLDGVQLTSQLLERIMRCMLFALPHDYPSGSVIILPNPVNRYCIDLRLPPGSPPKDWFRNKKIKKEDQRGPDGKRDMSVRINVPELVQCVHHGREVKGRHVITSIAGTLESNRQPAFIRDWEKAGYTVRVQERRGGSEQMLDEVLVSSMQQTILRFGSSKLGAGLGQKQHTLVLLSGDGNRNHDHGSFAETIQLALSDGMFVEIWAWRHSVSKVYTKSFMEHYGGSFSVRYLDDHRFANGPLLYWQLWCDVSRLRFAELALCLRVQLLHQLMSRPTTTTTTTGCSVPYPSSSYKMLQLPRFKPLITKPHHKLLIDNVVPCSSLPSDTTKGLT